MGQGSAAALPPRTTANPPNHAEKNRNHEEGKQWNSEQAGLVMVHDQALGIEVAPLFVEQAPVRPVERKVQVAKDDRGRARSQCRGHEQGLRDAATTRCWVQGFLLRVATLAGHGQRLRCASATRPREGKSARRWNGKRANTNGTKSSQGPIQDTRRNTARYVWITAQSKRAEGVGLTEWLGGAATPSVQSGSGNAPEPFDTVFTVQCCSSCAMTRLENSKPASLSEP